MPYVKLKIVVPITRMSGKMEHLASWLERLPDDDFAITLVHDIGDEETSFELKELIEKLNNGKITLEEGRFGSPGLARNKGLKTLDFEWINFSDSDDLVDIRQILKMVDNSRPDTEILVGDYWVDSGSDKSLRADSSSKDPFKAVSLNPGIWRMVFRRELVENFEFIDAKMAEDQHFLLQLGYFNRTVQFMPNIAYTYFSSFQGQATQNTKAVSEISKVIPLTLNFLSTSEKRSKKYLMVLYVRQIITEFMNGKSNSLNGAVIILAKRIFSLKIQNSMIFIWAFASVIGSKVKK
jgi:hypothetical protein